MYPCSLLVVTVDSLREYILSPHASLNISTDGETWTTSREKVRGTLLRWNGQTAIIYDGGRHPISTPTTISLVGQKVVIIPFDNNSNNIYKIKISNPIDQELREGESLFFKRGDRQTKKTSLPAIYRSNQRHFDSEFSISIRNQKCIVVPLLGDIIINEITSGSFEVTFHDTQEIITFEASSLTTINKRRALPPIQLFPPFPRFTLQLKPTLT